MKFYEYDAKKIFKKGGIKVPEGYPASSPNEVTEIMSKFDKSVVLKSQVLTGGRGKAGGIKFANTPIKAYELSEELFGKEIRGEKVEFLLVEEKIKIFQEFYLSVSIDRSAKKPVIIASGEGGMDIEILAQTQPEKIIKCYVDPNEEFFQYQSREIARRMGVKTELVPIIGNVIWKLYNLFYKYDAHLAEINPLVYTNEGILAADAKLEIEDDAFFRHKELMEMYNYKNKDFAFVKLDGDIAVIGNGAGLTLTGMDMIKLYGGEPATFLDIGGGADEYRIRRALKKVLDYDKVKVIFFNVLGGITRADEVAKGVINSLKLSKKNVPIVIRLTGTNEEEGQRLLEENDIVYETSMESAAKHAVEIRNKLISQE